MLAATSNQSTDTALIFEEFSSWLSLAAPHPQGYGCELQGREKAILSIFFTKLMAN